METQVMKEFIIDKGTYKATLVGKEIPDHDIQEIGLRIDEMLQHHPALLRNESLTFSYNQIRIFLIPARRFKVKSA